MVCRGPSYSRATNASPSDPRYVMMGAVAPEPAILALVGWKGAYPFLSTVIIERTGACIQAPLAAQNR